MFIVYKDSLLCAINTGELLSRQSCVGLVQTGGVGFWKAVKADLSLPPP